MNILETFLKISKQLPLDSKTFHNLEVDTNGGLKNEVLPGRLEVFLVEKLQVDCEVV
jgi:hypothetical protein